MAQVGDTYLTYMYVVYDCLLPTAYTNVCNVHNQSFDHNHNPCICLLKEVSDVRPSVLYSKKGALSISVTSVTLLLYGHSADGRGESFIPYSMTYQHNLHVTDPKLKIGVWCALSYDSLVVPRFLSCTTIPGNEPNMQPRY